jgi:hypothetical protein
LLPNELLRVRPRALQYRKDSAENPLVHKKWSEVERVGQPLGGGFEDQAFFAVERSFFKFAWLMPSR